VKAASRKNPAVSGCASEHPVNINMVERNEVSLATAKGVPVFLSLIIGYASYVITGPLAVEYLFNPPGGTCAVPVVDGST